MFENRFQNQVAIVTGGASGIGRVVAGRLAAEGAHVALFDVNEISLRSAEDELKAQGLRVSSAVVDIADEASVRESIEQVATAHGRLDVMVNCAAIIGPTNTRITDYSADDFDRVIAVNLRGSFLMTKYSIPPMLERSYGRILLMASISGKEGNPGMVGYSTTKAGVIGLAKAIGKEYAETGITVNSLAPAVIRTPMNENTAPETLKYMTDKIPMHRLGTVEETAALVCWIVSTEASFNTGVVFDLSGGRATY